MNIRTLMLGWEFPPFISGGLGTACHGLTKAMDRLGMQVTFVLPRVAPIHFRGEAAGSAEIPLELSEPVFSHVRVHALS
jgi:glycogen synthase